MIALTFQMVTWSAVGCQCNACDRPSAGLEQHELRHGANIYKTSSTTVLVTAPSFSISHVTTSPALSHSCGLRKQPTPGGVLQGEWGIFGDGISPEKHHRGSLLRTP